MEQSHSHHHHHTVPTRATKALVTGIFLNLFFVVAEAGTGLYTHSLSLLSDAGHNLSDVASLALALLANKLAEKKSSSFFSFGYRQSTVLVSLVNAGILLLAVGAIAYEAVLRIGHPEPVAGGLVAILAALGIFINGFTALLFFKDRKKDLNLKGAYLHMAADALVSLGVVIAGIVMIYTGWYWLDTLLSLVIVVVIVAGTWTLLKESLRLTLNGVPADIDLNAVRAYLESTKGVTEVHDLHIWAISTTETALTAHLLIPAAAENDLLLGQLSETLRHRFNIVHSTIQIEHNKSQYSCEQKCEF